MKNSFFDDCKDIDKKTGVVSLILDKKNIAAIVIETFKTSLSIKNQKTGAKFFDIKGEKIIKEEKGEDEIEVSIFQFTNDNKGIVIAKKIIPEALITINNKVSGKEFLMKILGLTEGSTIISKVVNYGKIEQLIENIAKDDSWLETFNKEQMDENFLFKMVENQQDLFPVGYNGKIWAEEKLKFLEIKAPEEIFFENNLNKMMSSTSQFDRNKLLIEGCLYRDPIAIRRAHLMQAALDKTLRSRYKEAPLSIAVADVNTYDWLLKEKNFPKVSPELSPSPVIVALLLQLGADPKHKNANLYKTLDGFEKQKKHPKECNEIRKLLEYFDEKNKMIPQHTDEKATLEQEVTTREKNTSPLNQNNNEPRSNEGGVTPKCWHIQ